MGYFWLLPFSIKEQRKEVLKMPLLIIVFAFRILVSFSIPIICFTDVLCEEGKSAMEQLLKFMVHPAISSINLTTALGSLATLARQRPMFMSEVIQAYETLHGK